MTAQRAKDAILLRTSLPRERWLALAGAASVLAALLILFRHWGFDDPYITYRYARNLLADHGLVYNVGQRTLSTTAPLYAVLLAALGSLWPDLPTLSNVISLVSLVGAGLCLATWPKGHPAAGAVAGLALSLWPLVLMTTGAETCMMLLLILGGFCAYERSHPRMAALALAFATMLRPDGILAAAVLAAVHWARRRPLSWQPLALFVVPVAAWYSALWLYYGSPLPVTLLAKQQQARLPISTGFAAGFLAQLRAYARNRLYWLPALLLGVGLIRISHHPGRWSLVLAWSAAYFAAYTALGVSRYFWYYAPLIPAIAILIGEGLTALGHLPMTHRSPEPQATAHHPLTAGHRRLPMVHCPFSFLLSTTLTLLLLGGLLLPLLSGIRSLTRRPDPRLALYRQAGEWLAAHTAPDTTVGALEVGIIGYYADRTIVDFAGLIQPDVARQLGMGQSYEDSALWAVRTYRPGYVLVFSPALPRLVEDPGFQEAYRPRHEFGTSELGLTLYERGETP